MTPSRRLFADDPEGGLSLTRIMGDRSIALAQRQSAGILLQKYISLHWYPGADAYEPPTTPAEVKDAVRPLLLQSLSDPESKIRSAAAFATSTVARFDWPEDWKDLLSTLVSMLQTGQPAAVHGAMRVVTEFVKNDLSEDQLLPVVRDLVPALLSILGNTEHTYLTRADTVAVYRHIITMLNMVKDEHPAAVRQALDQMAPVWFSAFSQLLAVDPAAEVEANWDSLALRIQIFRVLLTFQGAFPKYLAPHVGTFLRTAILNLTSLLPTFFKYYISNDPDAPDPPTPAPDAAYSAKMDMDDLACAIFEFMEPVVRVPAAKELLITSEGGQERGTAIMETIVGLVLTYTQVTREQEDEWLEDANAFVEDEDEDNIVYSLRIIGHDLMGSLIDKYGRPVGVIINDLAKRRVHESSDAHSRGEATWWKPLEALLGLIGGIADDVRGILEDDALENRPNTFDLAFFFDQVIPGLLQQSSALFLQGRAFVFASQFAGALPPNVAQQYLGAAIAALAAPDTSIPVKISAVKTLRNFCRFVDDSVMGPEAPRVLALLLPILPEVSNETLYLVMETVYAVLSLDKERLTTDVVRTVCGAVWEQWMKNLTDPVLTAIVEEIVDALASSPLQSVVDTTTAFFAPRIAELILTPTTEDTVYVPGEAVQLANALIKPRPGPLGSDFISSVTASIITLLRGTDDMDVIQHGMIHLTLVVRKDCDALIAWHAPDGSNGIACIFGLLGRFLAPTFSETGGVFVGDLIMHMFRKAGGAIAPVLGDLLRAIVNRLASATMPSFIQSLIIPFAYLFGTEYTEQTLELLSSFPPVTMPDGTQRPALDLVLQAWCEQADTITGSWNIRVSDLGLGKLFALPAPQLRNVTVQGDMVVDERNRNRIMTRSRTRSTPTTYTSVPFPVKALKLLLKDVSAEGGGGGKKKGGAAYDGEIEEDDGDEDWADDDPLGSAGEDEFAFLSDWLDGGGGGENDAQDDDEDLKTDPLAQIDMGEHITGVLRQCYASNCNGMQEMVDALSDQEKGILRGVLTV